MTGRRGHLIASPKGRAWSLWWRSACTARGWGATGRHSGVLHEGRGLVQYGQPLASTTPPSCSRPTGRGPAGNGPLIEHRRQPQDGPGVQIGDKGSDRSHPGGTKPHDSKVSAHAVRGSGGPLSPIWTPSGRFPRCSEASHRQDRWRAVGNVRSSEGQCASTWSINAVCRIEMAPTAGLSGRYLGIGMMPAAGLTL